MAYNQVLFLLNYFFASNRLKEGRFFLRKTQETITVIGRHSNELKQQLLQQMSQRQEVEIELVFR